MKKKIFILCLLIILITGCTKREIIKDEDTNKQKSYTSNIICKPTSKELIKIYDDNAKEWKINIKKLPECKDFNVFNEGYENLWTSIFVKPLAWIIIKVGYLLGNYGVSIILLGLILRIALYPLTKKSTKMNENMKKAKPELDNLEKKYKNSSSKDDMMKKSQEMMMIYKKYDISPLSGCLGAFLQLPLFFAFLEAINRVPIFFEEKFLGLNLGTTPWEGIQQGNYFYIILVILIIAATYFSFKNMNTISSDDSQAKTMKFMNNFMIVFISFVSFGLPTAIALYWIVSNGFTVIQNAVLKNKKDGGSKWKNINSKAKLKKI